MENIPRTHHTADPPRNPKVDGRIELYTRQFFMTRDAEEFFSWRSYSMSRVHTSSIFFHLYQKVGFVKIGPVLEATTNYHQGKPGIEIRIESLSGKFSIMGKDLKWTQQVREEFDRKIAYSRRRRDDSRIVPYSHQETDKPSARAKLKPTSSSLQPPALEQIPIHERK